jgi:hypothetical protein
MKTSKIILIFALLGLAMSGGVHRVAQSRWNNPSKTYATTLSVFFALDCDLPAAGSLWIGIPKASGFVPANTGIHAWPLGTTFAVPAKAVNAQTSAKLENDILMVSFTTVLSKNVAYGVAMTGSGAKVGSWAPISMETRMNQIQASAGPVLDTNNVFDIIAVAADPSGIVLKAEQSKAKDYKKKIYPGETATMDFTITFTDTDAWPATRVLAAGWNIVLAMGTNAAHNRVQGATGNWVKDPVTYEDWTWGSTCTNTLYGIVPVDVNTKAVTLTAATPKCTNVKTTSFQTLTIPIAEPLTAKDYSTMTIKFTMDIKMPSNRLGKTTDVIAYFYDSAGYEMLAVSPKQSILSVTKPLGDALAANKAKGQVAFGSDPIAPLETAKGTGIYSPPFCLVANKVKDNGYGLLA